MFYIKAIKTLEKALTQKLFFVGYLHYCITRFTYKHIRSNSKVKLSPKY